MKRTDNLATGLARAINLEISGKGAPEWVQLLPPLPLVVGRDGRSWINDDPAGVVDYLRRREADLPIDWEHATELKAPAGDQAPAAGWITEIVIKDGAVMGKVAWTPKGEAAVANREYRYLSPVLLYDLKTNRIRGLSSVGLVNTPNLYLPALNREQPQQTGERRMKRTLEKLGLPADAGDDAAAVAVEKLAADLASAINRAQSPSLEKFVPRADFDAALTRAKNAEDKLLQVETEKLEAAITIALDAALASGRISPATVEYHKASCRQDGGLARFEAFVKVAPELGGPSGLDGKPAPASGDGLALNAEQAKVAALFGNTVQDLKKYGA